MCSILEALVVLFNIVKHRLHVCLDLVAGQRGGGELCRAVLVRDLSELVLQCAAACRSRPQAPWRSC